ncbi:cytochrome P450 [Astrocystis sublimbata]|nr:cytochrome P450 [Astrocystis sublimbata]
MTFRHIKMESLIQGWSKLPTATWIAAFFLLYFLLYQYSKTKVDRKEPPVIASHVPFVGHLVGMALRGGKYMKNIGLQNKHLPIFTLPVPMSRLYIVTDPSLAAAVQRASKALSFTPIIPEVTERVLGLDRPTMEITRKNLDPNPGEERGFLADIQDMVYAHFGPGSSLTAISLGAARELRTEVLAFAASQSACTTAKQPIDMLSWVRHLVAVSTAKYFYGPQNPISLDPKLEECFWDFDHGLGKLLMNVLPSVTAGRAYKGREQLVEALELYLVNGLHTTGSQIVQERVEIALRHGWTLRATARSELSFLFAGIVNATTSTFWILLQIFADPQLLSEIREEIIKVLNRNDDPDQDTHHPMHKLNITDLKVHCPVLVAVYRECLRLGSDNYSTRMVKEDFLLADRYFLKKGAVVQIAGGVIHADQSIWGEAVETFNHHRFLNNSKQRTRQSQIHPAAFRAFGGGKTLCPGRHFAMNEILGLVALIVLMFDIEAPDGGRIKVPRKNDGVLPVHILEPNSDVKVVISNRQDKYAEACSNLDFEL